MIGHDENQEEVHYTVADRRKFNADGSLREGVTIEPAEAPEKTSQTVEPPEPKLETAQTQQAAPADAIEPDYDEDPEIPGAEDPASFVNFLSTLVTNAAAALGAVPHPATGQRSIDLESGKYWLDILSMLRDKTQGNLHPQESRLLDGLLADLRMQYVQIVRATEEKMKAQAAPKISGSDILGKK